MSIEERIKNIISANSAAAIKLEVIGPATRLVEDLEFDSLDHCNMVVDIEDAFVIEIPDAELEKVRTVQDVIDCVRRNMAVDPDSQ
jgi:acyl carrier protein